MTDELRRGASGPDAQHLANMEPPDVDPAKMARVRGLYGTVLTEDEVSGLNRSSTPAGGAP
jgi:hypothetical protein